jgi:hypothetical protein
VGMSAQLMVKLEGSRSSLPWLYLDLEMTARSSLLITGQREGVVRIPQFTLRSEWSTVIQTLDGRVATVVLSFYSLAVHLAIPGRN